jgi:GR25 family glycosyltransferase involved in LPS biosynthesis
MTHDFELDTTLEVYVTTAAWLPERLDAARAKCEYFENNNIPCKIIHNVQTPANTEELQRFFDEEYLKEAPPRKLSSAYNWVKGLHTILADDGNSSYLVIFEDDAVVQPDFIEQMTRRLATLNDMWFTFDIMNLFQGWHEYEEDCGDWMQMHWKIFEDVYQDYPLITHYAWAVGMVIPRQSIKKWIKLIDAHPLHLHQDIWIERQIRWGRVKGLHICPNLIQHGYLRSVIDY